MTDPFCDAAIGARWTDAVGQTATLTYTSKSVVTLTAGTSGRAALTFVPSFALANTNGFFYIENAFSGTSVVVAGPDTSDGVLPSILTADNTAGARIVSAGCTWWDVSSATSAGGSVIATEWSDYNSYNNAVLGLFPDSSLGLGSRATVCDRRKPCSWISRPSGPDAYNFIDITGAIDHHNRTAVTIIANGSASVPLIAVEFSINFEIQVSAESVFTRMVRPNPVSQVAVQAARVAGQLESGMDPFIAGGKDAVHRAITNGASRFVGSALGYGARLAGAYFGGVPGAIAGGAGMDLIMDVD